MKIAVTEGSGFIAGNLVERLASEGRRVRPARKTSNVKLLKLHVNKIIKIMVILALTLSVVNLASCYKLVYYCMQVSGVAWGSLAQPINVQPGDEYKPLFILLTNRGAQWLDDVNITLHLQYPFSLSSNREENSTSWSIDILYFGESITLSTFLDIDQRIERGIYKLKLTVDSAQRDESIDVDVPVVGYSRFYVSNVVWASQASPGDTNCILDVFLMNTGTATACNLTATLLLTKPFHYSFIQDGSKVERSKETIRVGDLAVGANVPLRFIMDIEPQAKLGVYKLNLQLDYQKGQVTTLSIDVPLTSEARVRIQTFTLTPSKVFPGDKNVNLRAFIVNNGTSSAQDLKASIELKAPLSASWTGSDEYFVGSIPPVQGVPLDFYLDIDSSASSPESVTCYLKMTYGNEGQYMTLEPITILISGKANFTLVGVDVSELHTGDTSKVIQVTLRNAGNETARGARVELSPPGTMKGSFVDYLGTMDKEEGKTATFVVNIDDTAFIGENPIDVKVSWTQSNSASMFSETLSFSVTILPGGVLQKGFEINGMFITWVSLLIVVASLVVAALTVSRLRRYIELIVGRLRKLLS